jgi:hypothetical protein
VPALPGVGQPMAYALNNFRKIYSMERNSFFIEFNYNNKQVLTEVKPCCQENDIFYYDIAIKNKYQFTVTPIFGSEGITWKVSFKNADKQVDPVLIDLIGNEIERSIFKLH